MRDTFHHTRDLLAHVVRFARLWRETSEPAMRFPSGETLSVESYRFWLTRIERQERNGTMRRD